MILNLSKMLFEIIKDVKNIEDVEDVEIIKDVENIKDVEDVEIIENVMSKILNVDEDRRSMLKLSKMSKFRRRQRRKKRRKSRKSRKNRSTLKKRSMRIERIEKKINPEGGGGNPRITLIWKKKSYDTRGDTLYLRVTYIYLHGIHLLA